MGNLSDLGRGEAAFCPPLLGGQSLVRSAKLKSGSCRPLETRKVRKKTNLSMNLRKQKGREIAQKLF